MVFLPLGLGLFGDNGRAQPIEAGLLPMWLLVTLPRLVFLNPFPQPHRFLYESFFRASGIL
jgi:hypothetical protein